MHVSKCSEVGVIFLSFWNQSKPFLPTHVGKQKQTNKLEFEWTTDVISIRRISDTEQSVSYYASVVGVFDLHMDLNSVSTAYGLELKYLAKVQCLKHVLNFYLYLINTVAFVAKQAWDGLQQWLRWNSFLWQLSCVDVKHYSKVL